MFIRYRKGLSELKTTIIGIAGGTGSGKSTFTNRLKAHFGDRVTVIYHDDYYRAHDEIPFEQRQYINYDHPDSLETDLLVAHLKALREGKSLRNLFDIKIFVEADADERILRRVLRDMNERGRDLENIISQYLTTVKPMHYLYVEPTKNLADIVINSGLNDVAFDIMKTKIQDILENGES